VKFFVSLLFVSFLLYRTPSVYAQTDPAQVQQQSDDQELSPSGDQGNPPEEADSGEGWGAPVPLALSIDAGSVQFSGETEGNRLQMGVQTGSTYDDNLLNTPTQPITGFTYSVMPNIRLVLSRRRLESSLYYAGGFQVNQRFSAYNQGSHSAGADVRYRLSPHVNLLVRDDFARTSSFFGPAQSDISGVGGGVIQAPNEVVLTPLSQRQDNLGTVQITYQYSAGDLIGAC
jgi:hypothetical protein